MSTEPRQGLFRRRNLQLRSELFRWNDRSLVREKEGTSLTQSPQRPEGQSTARLFCWRQH